MPNFAIWDEVIFRAAQDYGTPFHLYSEAGLRQTVRELQDAFSELPSFKEYFAVKALPTPAVLRILKEAGCGVDCSSETELMLAEVCGFRENEIMFSANDVPDGEFAYAHRLGAYINLDDVTHVQRLRRDLTGTEMPKEICLRYNPGGDFRVGKNVMGNPGEAKYGMTRDQLKEALLELKKDGLKRFGLHSFLSSNTRDDAYYPALARILFQLGAELMEETGVTLSFINLSGGIGIPYRPEETRANIAVIGKGVAAAYEEILGKRGIRDVAVKTELGRYISGPNGWLVTRVINEKKIYRHYLGVDASACDLMRPAMYGAYHHITVPGKEHLPHTEKVDVTGSLCENNDKFAVERMLPPVEIGDLLVIHDTGAHGRSMGYNYNGRMRCQELLLTEKEELRRIRRAETPLDYFATLDQDEAYPLLSHTGCGG